MSIKPICCYVNERDVSCDEPADFVIKPESKDPYDHTEACTAHVGELLGCGVSTVWPVEEGR